MKRPSINPIAALALLVFIASSALSDPAESEGAEDPLKGRAMLGVATASVAPSLRDHLSLEPGFGIQVYEVVENTPAAAAGLERHDILVKLDDQLLISPEHLSLLIGTHQPGDSIRLECIRKGERQTIEVTLGELDPAKWPRPLRLDRRSIAQGGPPPIGNWQEKMWEQQQHWQKWAEQKAAATTQGEAENDSGDAKVPEGRPEFPITVFGKEGVIKIDNPEGSVTLETEGGETRITIRDADDEMVHEGAFDPEAGMGSLPESAQEQLKKMNLEQLPRMLFPSNLPREISSPMPPAVEPGVL